jgi:serine/threonine-protein kinase HipA
MKNYKKKNEAYLVRYTDVTQFEEPTVPYGLKNRCLYCYERLRKDEVNYHASCNKRFFGQDYTPTLSYSKNQLEELASKVLHSQMAVTGVQAKVSLSLHKKEDKNLVKKLTIVGLYGDYILKPPSEYYEQLPELEDLTMHLAEVCGLKTVPHTLVLLEDQTRCYLTKRVDRHRKGKYHMEDMCQLTERLTDDKYRGSHEQVAKTLAKYSSNPLLDLTNFYELVVFCFLTGNADMHLKNFSLLENEKGEYNLAPAYDLVATALVNKADKEELALTLNGKKNRLKYEDFLAAFQNAGLTKKFLDKTLENFYYCSKEMKEMVENSFCSDDFKREYWNLMQLRYRQLGMTV